MRRRKFRGNLRPQIKGRPAQPPPEYGRAYRKFYFGKRIRRLIAAAANIPAPPYSPYAQDLFEELFLKPLREGQHRHFRNIAEALKSPQVDGYLDKIEHYVFVAFENFRSTPIIEGRWPSTDDVFDRAIRLWASMRLWGKNGHFPSRAHGKQEVKLIAKIDDLTEEERLELEAEIKKLPVIPNRDNVLTNTGLHWLKTKSRTVPKS
jgi:hypothetical protein